MKKIKKALTLASAALMVCSALTACSSVTANAVTNNSIAGNTAPQNLPLEAADTENPTAAGRASASAVSDNVSAPSAYAASPGIMKNAGISYLGPAGTYTEEAAKDFFAAGDFRPKETVQDAIRDVKDGASDYAVIPQENTLGGAVTNYVDALIAQEEIYVVGEVILPISQTLMALPGTTLEDIETVCSHAQGLKQSETWRAEHLPKAVPEEMSSTAAAASYVAESGDKSIAAIAAPGAAKLYGLEVLAENVQITDANRTRFYVLSASRLPEAGRAKTHAVFTASCEANRLDDIIIAIHDAGLELVTVHDRPEGSFLGNYNYIIEVKSGAGLSDSLLAKIDTIPEVRCLGSFNVLEVK